jgi:hypothetical protein
VFERDPAEFRSIRMAKVLGNPGRYVSEQSVNRYRHFITAAFTGIGLLCFSYGVFVAYSFFSGRKTLWVSLLSTAAFLLLAWLIGRVILRKMDAYETERMNFLKGATGEQAVARSVDEFPDEFCVIHDLATPFGNLDHVIVGPTGIFVLETKNWKGLVTADGRGGILCNGQRPSKDVIKPLIARMMDVRDKIGTLCDSKEQMPYFTALLVFPSARVEAKWGQTRNARCIRDEQLRSCIVEARVDRRLNTAEIDRLAHAFYALASMERQLQERPAASSGRAARS